MNNQQRQNAQVNPVAGIWICRRCGRRIQLISDGSIEKVQPFTCVCGNAMEPGPEHEQVLEDNNKNVVDG
jgi:hypothetical protein